MRTLVVLSLFLPALALSQVQVPRAFAPPPAVAEEPRPAAARLEVLDRIWRLTAEHFFDPELGGVDWRGARERYAPRAAAAGTEGDLTAVVNEMLGLLGASHTRYYTDRDPEYYFLRAVFSRALKQPIPEWADAGLVTVRLPEGTFVRDVLEGGPAAAAGIRVGDRLVWATGPFDPVASFEKGAGRRVSVVVQTERGGPTRTVTVTPRRISAQRAYLEATQASVRRIPLPDGTGEAGYVRLWALTHPRFLEVLEQALETLRDTDGLVLDLRGGFGGQSEDYLDAFLRRGAGRIESIDREGKRHPFMVSWEGPLVVLVDEGTRSAKELLAYSLQRSGRARLVGTRTAGAVLASRAFRITDRSLLLLPVADLRVDGERLEGAGVRPDVVGGVPLPFRGGADPQLERGLAELAALTGPPRSGAAGSEAARPR